MAIINYDQGDLVRVTGVFTTSAGTAIDPSVVKLAYRADAIGTTTIYTYGSDAALVRSGTGIYYADLDTNESPGRYEWNFYSTGTGQAAENGEFYVRRVLTTPAPPSDPMTTLAATNVTWAHTGTGATTRSVRDRLREIYSIYDYGAAGTGLTDDSTALSNAATAVSALTNGGDLHIPYGTFLISAAVSIPSDVRLIFHSGARLSIASGITVTIAGRIDGPIAQIFAGSGTVAFTSTAFGAGYYDGTVYPEWWGAIADGVTDCGPALQLAINSGARRIKCSSGTYGIRTRVLIQTSNWTLEGDNLVLSDFLPLAADVSVGGGTNAMFVNASTNTTANNTIIRNCRFYTGGAVFNGYAISAVEGGAESQQAFISLFLDHIWVAMGYNCPGFYTGGMVDCVVSDCEFELQAVSFTLTGAGISGTSFVNNKCHANTGSFILSTASSSNSNLISGLIAYQTQGLLLQITSGANWTIDDVYFEYSASAGTDGGLASFVGCTRLQMSNFNAERLSGDMSGILLDDCTGQLTTGRISGAGSTTAQDGAIRIKDSANLDLTDIIIEDDVTGLLGGQIVFDTTTGSVRCRNLKLRRGILKLMGMGGGASTCNIDITDSELINGEYGGASSNTVALIDLATSGRVTLKDSIIGEDSSNSNPIAKFRFTGTGTVLLENNSYIGPEQMYQSGSTQEVIWNQRPTMGIDTASASTINFIGTTSIATCFNITGTTTINLISGFSWQLGTTLTLIFDSTAALAHNQAASGTNYGIFMSSLGTYQARSGSVAALTLTSTATGPIWRALCSLP